MHLFSPLFVLLLLVQTASAVIIDSGDGTGNTSAPSPDPGWDHVGVASGLTAVYLGDGWVLTAAHVGVGPVDFGGTLYDPQPNWPEGQIYNANEAPADLRV